MTQTIDTRPQVVDVLHYAGDTLRLYVTIPSAAMVGMTLKAQIRQTRESDVHGAIMTVTPPVDPDAPDAKWLLQLEADDAAELCGFGAPARVVDENGKALVVQRYQGVWDAQISGPGYTRTIVQGDMTIDLDVTRD
jgi:hypothetical protein